ncbi:MAG: hypothetical protein QOE80_56 [Actinomycetota bacterium]|nr:hypothetical protein [Actinomycetota bacterium]
MRTTTTARIGATGAGVMLALGIFAAAPSAGATGTHGTNSADATCFSATGHTQGRSHSDPDGMSNGGADKPGCTGGFDADRDGNNGCGNDADREDDNNGWCGRKPKPDQAPDGAGLEPTSTSTTSTSTTTTTTGAVTPGTVGARTAEPTDCQVDPKEAIGCTATAQAAGTGAHLSAATTSGSTTPAAAGVAATDNAATGAGTTGGAGAVATPPATAPATEVLGETLSRPSALARTGAGVGGMALLGVVLCGSGRLAVLARRLLRIG